MTWQRASGTREAPTEPLWELTLDLGPLGGPRPGSLSAPGQNSPFWRHSLLMPPALLRNRLFCVSTVSIVCVTRALADATDRCWSVAVL